MANTTTAGCHGDGLGYLLWRYLTGGSLDGRRRTNAGWFRRGSRAYLTDTGRYPWRWDYLPRSERMAIRWATTAAALAVAYAYSRAPDTTVTAAGYTAVTALSVALAVAGFAHARKALKLRHLNEWVWPLHIALHRHLGYPEQMNPEHYLTIPLDFYDADTGVIGVTLPSDFIGTDAKHIGEGRKDTVKDIVCTKLGLAHSDMTWTWDLTGRNHNVYCRHRARPPARVSFADDFVRALIENAVESAPVIGLTHGGTVVTVDFESETPHLLVNAGSGGGKSETLKAIFAQQLHHGAGGSICDRKRHSHKWARGIPGIDYWRDIQDIHDGIIALAAEGDRRNLVVDDWEGDGEPIDPLTGEPIHRHVILLEEANATLGKLKRHWTKIRPKGGPKDSPAIEALSDILMMGRAVKMNVILVAQSATANALGGPEMRENFSTRMLARYTANAWKMLVPEAAYSPASRHPGRWQTVRGGVAEETQVVRFLDDEARAWAMVTERPAGLDGSSLAFTAGRGSVSASQVERLPDHQGEQGETVSPRPELRVVPENAGQALVTLAEALSAGVIGERIAGDDHDHRLMNVRAARQRDPEFPNPAVKGGPGKPDQWTPDALARWERNRPRAVEVS